MSREELDRAFAEGRPYFGAELAARQGSPRHHAYMRAAVRVLADQGARAPLILEVGSWAGASAITWARAIERWCRGGSVICVDHWSPYLNLSANPSDLYQRMDKAAREEAILPLFLHNVRACGLSHAIVPVRGCSRGVMRALPDAWFDLVYLDASRSVDHVVGDIEEGRRLLRDGGILCGSDLELQLSDGDQCLIERLTREGIDWAEHPGHGGFHPGVTLAVGQAIGRVPCWEGFWAVQRRGDAWNALDLPPVDPGWPEHLGGA